MSPSLLAAENLTRHFPLPGREPVGAVVDASLKIASGQTVVVSGPSGSGKTTLLMMLAGMLKPDSGKVLLGGNDIYGMSTAQRVALRAKRIGVVLPMFHLLPYLSAAENLMLAADGQSARRQAADLLDRMGLADRARQLPDRMSAGERRRLMVARALVNEPELILADEPTSNLDPESAATISQLLGEKARSGCGLLVVTHQPPGDFSADIVYDMRKGHLHTVDSITCRN
jgi:putative ABC transport system ATP-binding protein